jgi:anti-anti-sigma factor
MTLAETMLGGAAVVEAEGRIEMADAEAFQEALLGAVSRARTAVAVDMAGVDHISAAGLWALMNAHRAAEAAGKVFALAEVTPAVTEILSIGRFDAVFPVYPNVRDALAAIEPDGFGWNRSEG